MTDTVSVPRALLEKLAVEIDGFGPCELFASPRMTAVLELQQILGAAAPVFARKVIAHRYLYSDGSPETDWIDGPPSSVAAPQADGGSLEFAYAADATLAACMTDGEINQLTEEVLGHWPSFEAQSWACKVGHAVLNHARHQEQVCAQFANEAVSFDGKTTIREYVSNAAPEESIGDDWTKGHEACKRRIHAMLEQKVNQGRVLAVGPAQVAQQPEPTEPTELAHVLLEQVELRNEVLEKLYTEFKRFSQGGTPNWDLHFERARNLFAYAMPEPAHSFSRAVAAGAVAPAAQPQATTNAPDQDQPFMYAVVVDGKRRAEGSQAHCQEWADAWNEGGSGHAEVIGLFTRPRSDMEPIGYATFRNGRYGSWLHPTRANAESHDKTAIAGKPGNSEILAVYREAGVVRRESEQGTWRDA